VEAGDGGGRRWWCQALEVPSIAHANGPSILYNPFQAFPGVVQQALGQVALSCSSQGSHFQLVFVPAEAGRMLTKGIPFLFHYSCAVLESRDSMSISDDWFLCNQSKKKPH